MKSVTKVTGVGDSGLTWLRKSYQRCVEQAREEGRPLEELAAERWGVSNDDNNEDYNNNNHNNNDDNNNSIFSPPEPKAQR